MRVYITSIGLTDIDLINSLVAVIRLKNYTPEKVYLMCGRERSERLDHIRGSILDVVSGYGGRTEVTPVTLDDDDFIAWGRKVVEIVKFEKERGNTVALDVTSGVKSMNIGATLAAWNKGIDHIFLFCQGEYEGSERSIFDIPIQETHVHDFIQEAKQYERDGASDKPA